MDLTRKQWPAGWLPSDDAQGGRVEGLARMDNCYLEERGVVAVVPGFEDVAGVTGGYTHSIYNCYIGGRKVLFQGTSAGEVIATPGGAILDGGLSDHAVFVEAFGLLLTCSGAEMRKWDGEGDSLKIGLTDPGAPTVTVDDPPFVGVLETWQEESVLAGEEVSNNTTNYVFNTTETNGAVKFATNEAQTLYFEGEQTGTSSDQIHIAFAANLPEQILTVRVALVMDDFNYFWAEWPGEAITRAPGEPTVLVARRGEFTRVGSHPTAWNNITTFRFEVTVSAVTEITLHNVFVYGSQNGPLAGDFQWLQVNVYKNGQYAGKSKPSVVTQIYSPNNGKVRITPAQPPADEEIAEVWIYRRSAESNSDIQQISQEPKLASWHRIKVVTEEDGFTTEFIDNLSNSEAVLEPTIDFRIESWRNRRDDILGMVALASGRVLYLTSYGVVPSSFQDIDSFNPLHERYIGGAESEAAMWIVAVDPFRVLVGTTHDIYELSGTFTELPNGNFDMQVKAAGSGFPPIARQFAFDGKILLYLSKDGWRTLEGSTIENFNGELDLLFQGQSRHDFPAFALYPAGQAVYACTFYRGQFWASMPCVDGSRRTIVFDFHLGYWSYRSWEIIAFGIDLNGDLLMATAAAGVFGLKKLAGTPSGNYVNVQTFYDNNQQPRSRKDIFTLKVDCLTDVVCSVWISSREGQWYSAGTIGPASQQLSHFLEINSTGANLGREFAIRIQSQSAPTLFRFFGFSIEYDARPEQVNYLRIPPNNYGSVSRKRFITYPIVIDTLGSSVELNLYIDGAWAGSSTVNTSDKYTYIHYFTDERVGTDISATLSSSADNEFEFYQLNPEQAVSEVMPAPAKFLLIPQDDYGEPARKRHTSYKFVINTRGSDVTFTPIVDGVRQTSSTVNTLIKDVHEHFFTEGNVTGRMIGGELVGTQPFEFYGPIKPERVELLPPRLKAFLTPKTNFGVPAKKRIRTIPFRIDTYGYSTEVQVYVDGVLYTNNSSTSTQYVLADRASTAYFYFDTDVFGTDFELLFSNSTQPFEFYEILQPEAVEVLPPPKLFDQVGPIQLDRIGKLLAMRVRVIAYEDLPFKIYMDDVEVYSGTFSIVNGTDRVYSAMRFPKTLAGTTLRVEFGPTTLPFYRYGVQFKINTSGMETDSTWTEVK